uniref:Myelin oligodendrocyte glycoprotein n=1 Tax=Ailuropoda melanoleuca TaxID=9646 RepID=A0A7N5KFV5_AILME
MDMSAGGRAALLSDHMLERSSCPGPSRHLGNQGSLLPGSRTPCKAGCLSPWLLGSGPSQDRLVWRGPVTLGFFPLVSWTGQFRVIGPGHPIRALVGDEAELPCHIYPGKNATGMEVGWYRPPFSRVVHLYRNGKDQDAEQAPEYRGRTELLKDTMGEGKVTLRIRNVRFSDEGGFTCFFRDHSYQEEAAMELRVEDPFYWINPSVLVLIAVLPVVLLQTAVGLLYLCLQHRLRGKLRAEIENLHRTFGQFLEELRNPF